MNGLGNLVASGEVTEILNNVAWGTLTENRLGLETFDVPVSVSHHAVGDIVRWHSDNDTDFLLLIMGQNFMSLYGVTKTESGYEFNAGCIADRTMQIVGMYTVDDNGNIHPPSKKHD